MSIHETHRPHELHADCLESFKPTEVFSIEKQKSNLMIASDYVSTVRKAIDDSVSTLPFFAEKYNISASKDDYILVPVTVFLSGIPNKKTHTFTLQELTSADPYLGKLKYQTFVNKPLFTNHVNKDHTIAKGIILSASLQPVPRMMGDLYKVVCLQAFDRSTHPKLANAILSGDCHSYSMGATAKTFKCSICDAAVPEDNCGHIPKGVINGTGFTLNVVDNKVAYVEAIDVNFFEISALDLNNPANACSYNQLDEILRWQD